MSARNPAGDTQYNVREAALRGASLAFSKPPAAPKPLTNTYTGGSDGALRAAQKVGVGSPSTPLTKDWTGGSSRSLRPNFSPMQAGSRSSSHASSTLGVPDDHLDRESSPSNIAARLAAARHSPLRPMHQATTLAPTMSERHASARDILPPSGSVGNVLARLESQKTSPQPRKRRDSFEARPVVGITRPGDEHHKPTDTTPIPPTTSLVRMFEQHRSVTPTPTAVPTRTRISPPPVRSPKPQRSFRLPPEPQDDAPLIRKRTQTPPPVKPKPKHRIELPPARYPDGADERQFSNGSGKEPLKSPAIKQKPVRLAALRTDTPPPKQRGPRQTRPQSEDVQRSTVARRRFSTSLESEKAPSSPSSFKSAKEQQDEEVKLKPDLPPPRRSNTRKLDVMLPESRSRSTAPVTIAPRRQMQVSSPGYPTEQWSPPRRPMSATGTSPSSVYHNNYQRASVQQIAKHMTGESLSSAIMGAALAASSRNASPAPPQPITFEPLFPPRKQHHHHSLLHRSPSPPKHSPPKTAGKMRTTMRKEPSSSEDDDEVEKYKKKGTRIMGIKGRKHPNKHHEGTRKRWRDQITERERKRYEGVWAANKGLHLNASTPPARIALEDEPFLEVLNLVVKDIWERSRLPTHVLEEVWDLIDSRAIGRLKRDEFVVGLWLIDQRLKGRKLPIKVSESVWTSARGVGIKVKVRR